MAATAARPTVRDASTSGTGSADSRASLMVSLATSGSAKPRASAGASVDLPLAGGPETTTKRGGSGSDVPGHLFTGRRVVAAVRPCLDRGGEVGPEGGVAVGDAAQAVADGLGDAEPGPLGGRAGAAVAPAEP